MPESLSHPGTCGGRIPGADKPGRWRPRAAALAVVLCLAGPAGAAPPDQISLDLTARLAGLAATAASDGGTTATLMIAAAGLPALAARAATDPGLGPPLGPVLSPVLSPAALPETPPDTGTAAAVTAGRLNMRLALTMLSQAHGDENNGTVLAAQTEPGRNALVLKTGQARLADLPGLLAAAGLPGGPIADVPLFDGIELRAPLVIWPGAALVLAPGEVLQLSRADGAFVMNFGTLTIEGATVRATATPHPVIRSFRPFVTTADAGSLTMRTARVEGLGFGETLKFSGVSVLRSLLRPATAATRIEDSRFGDMLTLGIVGDAGALVRGNRFHDMRGAALTVARTARAQVTGNLFSGRLPTNAIRLEGGSGDGLIAGNVILGGNRAGIVVRTDSPRARVSGNVVWNRKGGGILLSGSPCGWIEGNLVIGNSQKGIELRDATAGTVRVNSVLSNDSAAIWVGNQPPGTLTRLEGNVLAFNGAGLAAASGGRLLLAGNDLSRQFLQFLSGDLVAQIARVNRDMRGGTPVVLTASGTVPPDPADLRPDPACTPPSPETRP
jgi:poly(beta-D-mannuronate) C5 epimerase